MKARWFRFHLLTAIGLCLVAGAIMGLNFRSTTVSRISITDIYPQGHAVSRINSVDRFGWPWHFPAQIVSGTGYVQFDGWENSALNVAVWIALLAVTGAMLEVMARRSRRAVSKAEYSGVTNSGPQT